MSKQSTGGQLNLEQRYERDIRCKLECFDRLILFGTFEDIKLPARMSYQAHLAGGNIMDYQKRFANPLREQMAAGIRERARELAVPIRNVSARQRKEDLVAELIAQRGEHPGPVVVLCAMESGRCFKPVKNHRTGFMELGWAPGQCAHYYVYFGLPEKARLSAIAE